MSLMFGAVKGMMVVGGCGRKRIKSGIERREKK
jgi:hypothetical protein